MTFTAGDRVILTDPSLPRPRTVAEVLRPCLHPGRTVVQWSESLNRGVTVCYPTSALEPLPGREIK